MSDSSDFDEFAKARDRLRETLKWLVGIASALGAALSAGISFTALARLEGEMLWAAAALGLVALIALIVALRILIGVLISQPYTLKNLEAKAAYLSAIEDAQLLPHNMPTWAELNRNITTYVAALAEDPGNGDADKALKVAQHARGRALSYASYLDLGDKVRGSFRTLGTCSLVILVCAAGIGFLIGKAGVGGAAQIEAQFAPGEGWSALAAALSESCGDAAIGITIAATDVSETAEAAGWVEARLKGRGACHDLRIALPRGDLGVSVSP